MELWILTTLVAASFQTLRFVLHKRLAMGGLSATASTFARFAYAAPAAAVTLGGYLWLTDAGLPALGPGFWLWAVSGGAAQILATVLVVLLFARRAFAIGITLKKSEVILTALLGAVLLGEWLPGLAWLAIALGLCGVLMLSDTPGPAVWWRRLDGRAVALGLGSGLFFALAGVGYRGATLAVESADPLLRAGVTLALVTAGQSAAMALWLRLRSPGALTAVWAARRSAVWLGLTSMAGSWGWFTAFTLQAAALVYALGQVELILSLLAGRLVFGDRLTRREGIGIGVLGVSILLVIRAG